MYAFPLGILAYIPGFIIAIIDGLIYIAIGNTIAMATISFIFFCKSLSILSRKIIFLVCLYLLSILLLLFVGSRGPGLVFLIASSVFSMLLISSKIGFYSLITNFLIYCFLSVGFIINPQKIPFFEAYSFGAWIAVGASFMLTNSMILFSTSSLINGLQKTILSEKKLKSRLKIESLKLIKAKEKAVNSEKMKSAFLANMSHEIRTPVNTIVGFANILSDRHKLNDQKMYIDIINKSSEQLLNLINDIINFSKIESGAIQIENKRIDFMNFLHTTTAALKSLCPPNLEFKYRFDIPNSKINVVIDEYRVNQIISNLITNAFKYTKSGYVQLIVYLSEENSKINFLVKDTGIGIPKEKQANIFERFFQENSTSEGVGLGLSIANALVNALNGSIRLESEVDLGTTFFVSIPNLIEKEIEPGPPDSSEIVNSSGKTNGKSLQILVAEDNDDNYEVLKEILIQNDNIVIRANNGEEAVNLVRNSNFEVVLMDIKMPVLNGYEATRQIRMFDMEIPIIAVTAFAYHTDRELALSAGCNDFISKPLDFEKLSKLLLKYTQNQKN